MNICWPKGCGPSSKPQAVRWSEQMNVCRESHGSRGERGDLRSPGSTNTIRLPCSRTETITLLSNFMNDLQSHRAFTVKAKVATGSLVWISYSRQLVGVSTLIWGLQLVDVNLTGCHCQIQVPGLPDLPTLSVVGKHMRTGMQSTLVKP